MATLYEVEAGKFNEKLAEELKKLGEFKAPEWANYVKSGSGKSRPPIDEDFWFKRAASILRQLYVKKLVGVERLKTRYGSRKNRGMQPEKFAKASGKIIRVILQQAEKAGLVEKSETKKKGRKLSDKGIKFLDEVAEKVK